MPVLPTRGRSGLSPPVLPLIPAALALLQPQMPSDPSEQRFTNARVDSGGIFQGVKMGFPFFFQECGIRSCSDFCRVRFRGGVLSQKCTHIYTHTSRALFGCSWMQFFPFSHCCDIESHRITESFRSEKTFRIIEPSC